jgi:hypothetical protein
MSVNHMPIDITTTILSLFQTAILPDFLSALPREDYRNAWETYTRSTINNEEVAKAK